MLEDLLSKLGASTRITVGVSVSPSVGLEMVEIDRLTGTVTKYAYKPLEYNFSTREITDYNKFSAALEDLFEELHIPKKSNIILSIPNVHFGMITLPLLLTDEAITNAIISEVEQSYIFKRQEPVVTWAEVFANIDTENRTLAYTAIQKPLLDGIIQSCEDIGCTLVGLENSYSSLLRALYFTDTTKEQMKEGTTWNLMIIGQNSYSIISMLDKKVVEYYEEPLALKSFVDDEIYNAITTSAQLTLAGLPANNLFILSETDLVSAEVLSLKLPFEGTIKFLECNKYTQNELTAVNLNILPKMALKITPEVIGATVYPFCDFPLKLNVLKDAEGELASSDTLSYPKINIGNIEIELTPDFIKRLSIIVGAIIIVPMLIFSFILGGLIIPKEQAKLNTIEASNKQIKAQIDEYTASEKSNTFNPKSAIDKIVSEDKLELNYYSAIGISIPNKLWITYYMSNGAGKVDIKGKSDDVESIYTFYKNIKQLINNSDIKLYKLEMDSASIDSIVENASSYSKTYEFEITNMTEAELNPQPATAKTAATTQPTTAPTQDKQESSNSSFPFGKPLFGKKDASSTNGNNAPSGQTAPPPPAPAPTQAPKTPEGEQLPKNLQKIEKF